MSPTKENIFHTTKGLIASFIASLPAWIENFNNVMGLISLTGGVVVLVFSIRHLNMAYYRDKKAKELDQLQIEKLKARMEKFLEEE